MRALVYYADGLSGKAATARLAERGEEVVLVDRTLGNEEDVTLLDGVDVVVKTPGVPPGATLLRAARERGVPVWAEVELGFRLLPGSRFVGVTGTNGKTTTAALLGAIFRAAGRHVTVAGNIGVPLTSVREADWVVCELSSFQLEDIDLFACAVAVLLNLEPDHLDRYASFEDYRDAKLRIFERARAKIVPRGLGLPGTEFSAVDPLPAEPLIRGAHNRENAAAATAAARAAGIGDDAIAEALRTFPGVPHRLEPVGEAGGVRFINDSKATNVAASRRALAAYAEEPVHLILGGSLKGESFEPLVAAIGPNVRSIHLVGEAAATLADALAGRSFHDDGTLERAVAHAAGEARPGDVVLLSPACASYDQFENFEHRGDEFRRLVAERGSPMTRFLRRRDEGEEQRATTLELFYDLVFVFAITQVSHLLLDELTWRGAGRALVVLLVVWWAWNYTTWVTNELDPDSVVVRLVLMAIMFASLLMAVAIPEAFGDRALLFAGSYVAIQVGRHAFLTFASASAGTIERERAARILTWLSAAGVFWLAGALADDSARALLWLVALAIDYCGPIFLYWVPGRRHLTHGTWDVETAHFAERFQLFIIIALGESIVIIGATTADLQLDAARTTAFGLAFLATAAMWWLYFSYVAGIAQRRLEVAPDRTRLARDGYTYLHVVLVAGVIVSAVGEELVIAHPTDVLPVEEVVAVAAGPAIYLIGHVLFRLVMAGSLSRRRLGGALACVAVGLCGAFAPALALAALLVAVLVTVIVAERVAWTRDRARGVPSPAERLDASVAARDAGG